MVDASVVTQRLVPAFHIVQTPQRVLRCSSSSTLSTSTWSCRGRRPPVSFAAGGTCRRRAGHACAPRWACSRRPTQCCPGAQRTSWASRPRSRRTPPQSGPRATSQRRWPSSDLTHCPGRPGQCRCAVQSRTRVLAITKSCGKLQTSLAPWFFLYPG